MAPEDDARAALDRLADLWRREREETQARFAQERKQFSHKQRVRLGIAASKLTVVDVEPAPGGLSKVWVTSAGDLELLRLSTGEPVVLWRDRPDEEDAVPGTLARRTRDKLAIMVPDDLPDAYAEWGFNLDREAPVTTFERGDRAIAAFRAAEKDSPRGALREVLFGGATPTFRPEVSLESKGDVSDTDLNAPQRAAVARALAAEQVALIHGPPGTGKTRTLVEVIRQAVAAEQRVLATAASNAAVDNLAERLVAAGVEVVRLGHPARVSPGIEDRLLSVLVDGSEDAALARSWFAEARKLRMQLDKRWARRAITYAERREALGEIRALQRDARRQLARAKVGVLAETPVVCATAAGADSALLGNVEFDLVVLDEATQAVDPMALSALSRAGRVVLAGDPCQLPPTVLDRKAERDGLGTTIFERLAARAASDALRLLTVQHRMHAVIMRFPSESKYEGRLVAADAVAAHTLEDLPGVAPDPLRRGPLVFVDTAGKGWDDERDDNDPSSRNPSQADRTAREVRRLLSRGVSPAQVGVITPYHAQVRLLRKLLAQELADGLEIRSVDGFQGREKEAIVVDMVRSNEDGRLGFLADTRRMNVALTRARRFLLVVGDSALLGRHPYYSDFLEAVVESADAYVSAWADEADPVDLAESSG